MLRDVIQAASIPDYDLSLDADDMLYVRPQVVVEAAPDLAAQLPPLAQATLETARTRAPGWDVYALEADWRGLWRRSGRPRLRSPDKAFLGWLDKRLAG